MCAAELTRDLLAIAKFLVCSCLCFLDICFQEYSLSLVDGCPDDRVFRPCRRLVPRVFYVDRVQPVPVGLTRLGVVRAVRIELFTARVYRLSYRVLAYSTATGSSY